MNATNGNMTMLVICDHVMEIFTYCSDMSPLGSGFDRRPLWLIVEENGVACAATANALRRLVQDTAQADGPCVNTAEMTFRHQTLGDRVYRVTCISTGAALPLTITLTDVDDELRAIQCADQDDLTGLLNRSAFCHAVDTTLEESADSIINGQYAMISLDLLRFKAINDLIGRERGDQLLCCVADCLREGLRAPACACRIVSDHFAIFMPTANDGPESLLDRLQAALHAHALPFEIGFSAGVYVTDGSILSANAMIDRANLALGTIKGRYDVRSVHYTEKMRSALLSEQEIEGMMEAALEDRQFIVHLQPQYNHTTGMLIGAEALVRWQQPERGLIPPGDFIPIFEKNGFITRLDLYVFEQACAFQQKCLNNGWAMVPISTNFSRYDIFEPDFVGLLEEIRTRYGVPAKYLRVELTESAMVGGVQYINEVIARLHEVGYVVEMDDFGSGYSSLTVLKDIDLDVIKLDMQFLRGASGNKKGGTILSSVIRMAKWLSMPVIAEGVETVEQADYLRSIGCDYIQGYLYSRPLPQQEYAKLVSSSQIGAAVPQLDLVDTFNAFNFWDPSSQETLIFSNYVGAAAIFHYHKGEMEILRVNKKYLQELSMNLTEKEIIETDPLGCMDEENRKAYLEMLDKAITTMEEQSCESWRTVTSSCCGEERFCIRTTMQVIGVSGDRYLFHAMIRNITAEKLYYQEMADNERCFKHASEQVNIYFWEYNILTREMRPCFRCMRDLGLPPLVRNYPEPLIESGAIPSEVADSYRAWLADVVSGGSKLEAIVPLTDARIPFRFRYTLEYDENGHPIKAYGSAALIVD